MGAAEYTKNGTSIFNLIGKSYARVKNVSVIKYKF